MKILIASLLCGWSLAAQIAVAPLEPVVAQGGVVKFTAKTPVTWSLAPGSPGTIDAEGAYHAPDHVTAKAVVGGCQVLPNDHLYNTKVDTLPVDVHSREWIAVAPSQVGLPRLGDFGINLMTNAEKQTPQHFAYTPGSDGNFYIAPPEILRIEHGSHTYDTLGYDRHMISINRQTCVAQEIYAPYPMGMSGLCPKCTGQGGIQWKMLDYTIPPVGTDAAGLQLLPLTYRRDEIVSGNIQHAGRFTLSLGYIAQKEIRWPARGTTGGGPTGKVMPMGARIRLKASFPIDSLASPYARNLATAFAKYGLILADVGGSFQVQTESDVYDPQIVKGLQELWRLKNTDFEVVDESSLMLSRNSGRVNPGNGYVNPGSVTVIATDSAGKQTATNVILQAVTLGVESPWLAVQAGSAPLQIKAWVNGTQNQGLTWTLTPALGTLSPTGIYRPPANLTTLQTASIKVTSRFDPSVSATVGVSVLPGGVIRINSGGTTDYTDPASKVWYGDLVPGRPYLGMEQGAQYDYSSGHDWRNTSTPKLFNDWLFGFDLVYRLIVPDGNYKVTLKLAEVKGVKPGQRCLDLEAQGQIVYRNWDTMARTGAGDTAIDVVLPAKVTGGALAFALRDKGCSPIPFEYWTILGYQQDYGPGLGAFQIEPDQSPPHLSIENAPAAVTMGQNVHLRAVAWYLDSGVKWNIVSGPGSISADGIYSAPKTPQNGAVTLQAVSLADPSKTVSATLKLTFGEMQVNPPAPAIGHSLAMKLAATIGGVPYSNVTWRTSLGAITEAGLYTAPASIDKDTPVSITATSKDDPSKSATANITVLVRLPPIRINCGDLGEVRDAAGNLWDKDPGPAGGGISTAYNNRNPIANAPPELQPLYQSARYIYGGVRFWYTFAVPNGTYRVTLKFADYAGHKVGIYRQTVILNGTTVLSGFDIVAAAGGPLRAIDQTYTTVVKGSSLKVEFVSEGPGLAQINGIEITDAGPAGK